MDPVLYGWRLYGDLGMVGGASTLYPPYYATKLMQYFVRPGDTIIGATSDYALLAAYAARSADGALTLLAVNKDPVASFTAQIALHGFVPATNATARAYGETQDTAAETGMGSPDIALANFGLAGTNFSYTFPPYSLTVLTLAPEPPRLSALSRTAGGAVVFQLQGQPGARYVVQYSTNLAAWTSFATNTPTTTAAVNITNATTAVESAGFYRAAWLP
jgi:hypothetical protein